MYFALRLLYLTFQRILQLLKLPGYIEASAHYSLIVFWPVLQTILTFWK